MGGGGDLWRTNVDGKRQKLKVIVEWNSWEQSYGLLWRYGWHGQVKQKERWCKWTQNFIPGDIITPPIENRKNYTAVMVDTLNIHDNAGGGYVWQYWNR